MYLYKLQNALPFICKMANPNNKSQPKSDNGEVVRMHKLCFECDGTPWISSECRAVKELIPTQTFTVTQDHVLSLQFGSRPSSVGLKLKESIISPFHIEM